MSVSIRFRSSIWMVLDERLGGGWVVVSTMFRVAVLVAVLTMFRSSIWMIWSGDRSAVWLAVSTRFIAAILVVLSTMFCHRSGWVWSGDRAGVEDGFLFYVRGCSFSRGLEYVQVISLDDFSHDKGQRFWWQSQLCSRWQF